MKEKAFPFGDFEGCSVFSLDKSCGMDLRDYFAIRAMQTVIPQIINKKDLVRGP